MRPNLSQANQENNVPGSLLVLVLGHDADLGFEVAFSDEGINAVENDPDLSPETKTLIRERVAARDTRIIVLH